MASASSFNIAWVPLPNGRAWWPGIVLDVNQLDPEKHAEAIQFYSNVKKIRGYDALNKDCLVLLCGVAFSDTVDGSNSHRFAVLPATSLRSYPLYAQTFAVGVISSGPDAGKPCSPHERIVLQTVLANLVEFCKRLPQPVIQVQQQITQQYAQGGSLPLTSPRSQMGTQTPSSVNPGPPRAKSPRSLLEENRELTKLKKELVNVRRKISTKSSRSYVSLSPSASLHDDVNLSLVDQTAPDSTLLPQPQLYPEITSQTLRIWDFCHSFSQELNLTSTLLRRPFASFSSFEASLAEPECSLFAQIACQLVSYVSIAEGDDPEDRWEFDSVNGAVKAKLGSRCTPLTWECLWQTLLEKNAVAKPPTTEANPSRIDILDALVQACSELDCTRSVISWRLSEFAAELSTPIEAQLLNSLQVMQPQVDSRSSQSANQNMLKTLTHDVFASHDLFKVEKMIETCRGSPDHERLDPETGGVVWRSMELANAMVWEEKLLARFLSAIRELHLSKRTRSMSFGKDHMNRSLFAFTGDDDDEECRIWAREDDTDRWFVYRGESEITKLISQVSNKETKGTLMTILYSGRRRTRPFTVIAHKAAKNVGWRFTGNPLLGREVRKYTLDFGVCPGVVTSWRSIPATNRVIYRVVFTKQEWKSGLDFLEEDLIHLLAHSDRLAGDFPFSAIPPHPLGSCVWNAYPKDTLALVHCPMNKYIAMGVILATSAPINDPSSTSDYDAVILADGGEFVFVFGKKQVDAAIQLAHEIVQPSSANLILANRVNRVERFHPLTHHSGPLVGAQGVVELWGKIVVESVFDLRQPMLQSEDAFIKRAPNMWGMDPSVGQSWRDFVSSANSVEKLALALECLLDFAARAAAMGYFQTPPPAAVATTIANHFASVEEQPPVPVEQTNSSNRNSSERDVKRQKMEQDLTTEQPSVQNNLPRPETSAIDVVASMSAEETSLEQEMQDVEDTLRLTEELKQKDDVDDGVDQSVSTTTPATVVPAALATATAAADEIVIVYDSQATAINEEADAQQPSAVTPEESAANPPTSNTAIIEEVSATPSLNKEEEEKQPPTKEDEPVALETSTTKSEPSSSLTTVGEETQPDSGNSASQ